MQIIRWKLKIRLGNWAHCIQHASIMLKSLVPHFYSKMHLDDYWRPFFRNPFSLIQRIRLPIRLPIPIPHRNGNLHATWDHTVLPATQQSWHSRPYPSRSWYSIKRPRTSQGWVDLATLPRNLQLMACFADINVSEGSIATYARCGGILNMHLTANIRRNFSVKKIINRLRFDRIMAISLWPSSWPTLYMGKDKTSRSSAIADGPRDASCQFKSC